MVVTNDISPWIMDRRSIQILASEAMKGLLYKALIEVITNSIASYNSFNSSTRAIYIDCDKKTRTVRVYDRATGLSPKDFETKIFRHGSVNDDFMNNHGNSPRGRFGMGVKDICDLGSVKYESIKDGQYSILSMGDNFVVDTTVHENWVPGTVPEIVTRKATNDDYVKVLNKPKGSGTLITIRLKKRVNFPEKLSLMNQLSHHFELQRTLQIAGTDIRVRYDGGKPEKVRYFPPKRNLIYEKEIVIPGFKKIYVDGNEPKAKVSLYQNEDKESEATHKQGTVDLKEFREHGFSLNDGTETVFDNYFFKYDSNAYSSLTNSFYGEIECPYINDLFRQRDEQRDEDEGPSNNNTWIITRTRDGLDKSHPFIKALATVINPILDEFIKPKTESEVGMSEGFQSIASQMGRELRNELNKMFQEDEDDVEDDGDGDLDKPMSIIPGMAYLEAGGDSKVFTVKIQANKLSPDAKLEVEFSDMEKIDLLKKSDFAQSDQDFYTAQIHIRAISDFEEEIMEIKVGDLSGIATLSTDEHRYKDDVIEEFKFEHETITVRPNKNKKIRLYIPTELYDAHIDSGEPKVSIRKPDLFYLDIKNKAIFKESVGAYQKTIGLHGKSLGSNDEITAVFGDKTATCRVSVTNNQSGRGGVKFKFDSNYHKRFLRGLVDKDRDGLVCEIMTEHPVAKRILGTGQEGQETPEGKTLLAEIIAGAWADYFIGKTSRVMRAPEDVVFERNQMMNRFLAITTKLLVGNKIG